MGVIPFCAHKNGVLHKILRGHVFCAFKFFSYKKETTVKILKSTSQFFFLLLCFVAKSLCSFGELNFSQEFRDERRGIASVTESLFKVSFVFIKILLD